jgi:hypothetical protein
MWKKGEVKQNIQEASEQRSDQTSANKNMYKELEEHTKNRVPLCPEGQRACLTM